MLPLKCKIQLLYKITRYYIYQRVILVNVYNLLKLRTLTNKFSDFIE